jgi:hypothetical protein
MIKPVMSDSPTIRQNPGSNQSTQITVNINNFADEPPHLPLTRTCPVYLNGALAFGQTPSATAGTGC